MKCETCGQDIDKGMILDHFGRSVKAGDVILFMLPMSHRVIRVEGAEITLKEPLTYPTPVAVRVEEVEYCPFDDDKEWGMFVRGYHCVGIRSKVSQTITGRNGIPHPDIYQLNAKNHEVF